MKILAHCGPIHYPGRTVRVEPAGVQTFDDSAGPAIPPPEPWSASWIWLSPDAFPDYQAAPYTVFCEEAGTRRGLGMFRKKIYLDAAPDKVVAWVSADAKYRLYVNGIMAGRGPAEVGGDYGNQQPPDWWFYDCYDLTPLFQAGENILLAEVVLGPVVQADYSMGRGGLLFQADLSLPFRQEVRIVSDDSWKGMLNRAFLQPYGLDARLAPVDMYAADCDDGAWPAAQIISPAANSPWNLIPRQVPPLAEARLFPAQVIVPFAPFQARVLNPEGLANGAGFAGRACTTVLPGSPLTMWFEFERELTGHPQFCVEAAAGTVLELGLQEIAGRDDRMETCILSEGLQNFESVELHAFQYLRLTVTFPGGGACQIPLKIYALAVNFTSFPLQYRGHFACSDPFFNVLWETARWTTQLCLQSYHLDSPIHQEGLGCTGDYLIEALVSQCAFGEPRLARQDLLRTAYLLRQKNGRMFHTSYSLLVVQMLADYWNYTGDMETVRAVLPAVQVVLGRFQDYVGSSGLVTEAPDYMFMDWVQVDGFELHHPPCVLGQGYLSAFYYRALLTAADLCRLVGLPAEAELYTARAWTLGEAFRRELWVPEKGLFCDGRPFRNRVAPHPWLPEDRDRVYFSKHTNALAVAYHLAPPEQAQQIVHRMMNDPALTDAQPYFMHFVFEALHQAGLLGVYGFDELRRWKVLLDEHPTSLKECWNAGDYSHAWGGTPAYQFVARVLGITPAAPGFLTANLRPNLGDLAWAEGRMPTLRGVISCRWEQEAGRVVGTISIPTAITAYLTLPVTGAEISGVRVNGRPVSEHQRVVPGGPEICLPGGDYRVEL